MEGGRKWCKNKRLEIEKVKKFKYLGYFLAANKGQKTGKKKGKKGVVVMREV